MSEHHVATCAVCYQEFDDPTDAYEHKWRTGHRSWSIPHSWLKAAGVLSVTAFWREARRGLTLDPIDGERR